jgi:hypothetical protein
MAMTLDDLPVTVIGHPWAPIGMGEQLRSHLLAGNAVRLNQSVFDVFRYAQRTDPVHANIVGPLERGDIPGGIRIFHINGDEVESVLAAIAARGQDFAAGYNIVVPAWELPAYPAAWAAQLRRFDEVWALSSFIQASLKTAGIDSHLVGQAVETSPEALAGPFLPRRHFGIRESAFTLLSFFDLSSYASRKNPQAVLALFAKLRAALPWQDLQLVLKAKNGERAAEEWAAGIAADAHIEVLFLPLDSHGVRSLINACDCFVSLHRSEGFGRGPGEAMALGRLAMATGWSGNVDFMTAQNALLVRHDMVALQDGDYPHWEGQDWADPDVGHAFELLRDAIADRPARAAMARRGRSDVLRSHGNRAVGLRILDRLQRILAEAARFQPEPSAPAVKPKRRRMAKSA